MNSIDLLNEIIIYFLLHFININLNCVFIPKTQQKITFFGDVKMLLLFRPGCIKWTAHKKW
jgi:hypothetical protein